MLTQKLEGFQYEHLETSEQGASAVNVALPDDLADLKTRGFNMNDDGSF